MLQLINGIKIFKICKTQIGFQGKALSIFKALDKDNSHLVSLNEIDQKAYVLFKEQQEAEKQKKMVEEQKYQEKMAKFMHSDRGADNAVFFQQF